MNVVPFVSIADFRSANIVGYQQKSYDFAGMTSQGSGFFQVGAATKNYSIQNLVPSFPTDAVDPLKDIEAQVQIVGPFGTIDEVYYYLVPGSEAKGFEGAGWYTADDELFSSFTKATKTFAKGEGFLYNAPYAYVWDGDPSDEEELEVPTKLQASGEVDLTAKTVELSFAGLWSASFDRPVECSIQKLVPTFPPEAVDPLKDIEAQVQIVGPFGTIDEVYYYLVPGSEAKGFEGAGWYTADDELFSSFTKATKTFAPGEGFLYNAPYAYVWDGDPSDEEELQVPTRLTYQE